MALYYNGTRVRRAIYNNNTTSPLLAIYWNGVKIFSYCEGQTQPASFFTWNYGTDSTGPYAQKISHDYVCDGTNFVEVQTPTYKVYDQFNGGSLVTSWSNLYSNIVYKYQIKSVFDETSETWSEQNVVVGTWYRPVNRENWLSASYNRGYITAPITNISSGVGGSNPHSVYTDISATVPYYDYSGTAFNTSGYYFPRTTTYVTYNAPTDSSVVYTYCNNDGTAVEHYILIEWRTYNDGRTYFFAYSRRTRNISLTC